MRASVKVVLLTREHTLPPPSPSSVSFLDLSPSSLSPMAFRLSSLSLPSHLLCRQEVQSVLKEACFLHCLEEMELKGITNPSVVGGRVCSVCVCVCMYGHRSLCVQLAWGLWRLKMCSRSSMHTVSSCSLCCVCRSGWLHCLRSCQPSQT